MCLQIYGPFKMLSLLNETIVFLLMIPHFCYVSIFDASSHTHTEQTSQEVKKEVEQHLKEKDRIENSLPSSIVIGPFIVRVEAVRQALSNKRKALANAMLDNLALKLRKRVDDVSHLFAGQNVESSKKYFIILFFFFYTGPTFTST